MSIELTTDVYGREIKKGIVFGYLCSGTGGHNSVNFIYRFGRTSKEIDVSFFEEGDRTKVYIEKLGAAFGGLNRPDTVILWEKVQDVHKAWDIVRDYLRDHHFCSTETRRPKIIHESTLGDNFFSLGCKTGCSEFEKHLKEAFAKLLSICK